jgi:LacI family transcriptional regulator
MTPDGPRIVTLKDVAAAADVHVSTASRALDPAKSWRISPETIARVHLVAEQLGYMPDMIAKGLKRGTTMMVGVIVPDLDNPFIGPFVRGITREVEKNHLVTVVTETFEDHERFERALNYLVARRVDAVITTAARVTDRHLLTSFARRVPAIVLAVRNISGSGLTYIIQDDRLGGELVAEHLIGLGHEVVAQLRGPTEIDTFENRSEGFRRAAGAAGLIDVTISDSAAEVTLQEGRRLMSLTLEENLANPPTAVFAHADAMAIGAIEELRARHLRCPQDISIVGYDDAPLVSHTNPPLTTISLPGEEIGRRAGMAVIGLMADPASDHSVSLPADLIVRSSAAPPGDRGELVARLAPRAETQHVSAPPGRAT